MGRCTRLGGSAPHSDECADFIHGARAAREKGKRTVLLDPNGQARRRQKNSARRQSSGKDLRSQEDAGRQIRALQERLDPNREGWGYTHYNNAFDRALEKDYTRLGEAGTVWEYAVWVRNK